MTEILTRSGSCIAIIILGYVLRKVGFFGEETFGVLSKITLKITLPAAIISGFAGKQVDPALISLSLIALHSPGLSAGAPGRQGAAGIRHAEHRRL